MGFLTSKISKSVRQKKQQPDFVAAESRTTDNRKTVKEFKIQLRIRKNCCLTHLSPGGGQWLPKGNGPTQVCGSYISKVSVGGAREELNDF